MLTTRKVTALFTLVAALVFVAGCGNLQEQPKLHKPYEYSPTFGSAARNPLPQAVSVGSLQEDEHLYTGMVDGEFVDTFPFEVTQEMIDMGQREFDSYCMPCHGISGYGDGVLSEEGFPPPASFHDEEIAGKPVGSYYDVITNGQGAMYSYDSRVTPEERWALAAYIRVLQYSQNAQFDDLPSELQENFN
jgi:cytochrome c553